MEQMNSELPYYDAPWLNAYRRARRHIEQNCPQALPEFQRKLSCLRTDPFFKVRELDGLLSPIELERARNEIRGLKMDRLEMHETMNFGRFVVHNLEYFNHLQRVFTPLVSEAVGEPVEPSYNFLSMYFRTGVCPLHMDAPSAKWTLDLCLEQSLEWPIHISRVEEWPEKHLPSGWQSEVLRTRKFDSFVLKPGSAIIFSGSSQWHYRDSLPVTGRDEFCNLVFFHYIPKGSSSFIAPEQWGSHFGLDVNFVE